MSNDFSTDSLISHYRIVSRIGAGGMGVVYHGRDARLEPGGRYQGPPRRLCQRPPTAATFRAGSPSHKCAQSSQILTVYDIGNHEGAPYIVAELLEGQELRKQLDNGKLTVRKAIDYARQIVAGLAAAYEKGVVHRDLKPENLFVTKDGRVKILDFGLAKSTTPFNASADSGIATQQQMTSPGMVMGTVGYMSPEQVRGEVVDHRSDIFSFGLILFEMLRGERAFQRETVAETMTAILKEDVPEMGGTRAGIPPQLEKILRRCLEKKADRRFQSASDLGFALEAMTSHSEGSVSPLSLRRMRRNGPRLSQTCRNDLFGLSSPVPSCLRH